MTKAVEIKNADGNTSVKVVVVVQDLIGDEWKEVDRRELPNPEDVAKGLYLTSSRRLIVQEEPAT